MSRNAHGEHPYTESPPERRFDRGPHAVVVLGARAQIVAAVTVFVVSAWLTVSTVSYIGSRNLLTDKVDYINSLEEAYADLRSEAQVSTAAFIQQVEALERTTTRQQAAIDELVRIQQSLQRQLQSRERQVAALHEERDRALERADDLGATVTEIDQKLAKLLDERRFLSQQLDTTQARLADVSHQRDLSRRTEQGLRWQIARLQSRLEGVRENRESAQIWFKDYVTGSVDALEQLFIGTGIDLETLVARAAGDDTGQGGPYQGIDAEPGGIGLAARPDNPLTDDIRRLSALQKLASAMPLASPLDHFHVTSHYGKRRDPLTRNWAFHGGIDLGAAPGSKVLATAPGRVVYAGPSGPYGNMVEVDHGMGVITRYGHMKSVSVEAGQEVEFRHEIGVIGNSGRSTGRHLHYEVRVDDSPHDPGKFLEAGRYLVDIFNFRPPGGTRASAGQS